MTTTTSDQAVPLRSVVVGVDRESSSDAAVDWAANEALRRGLRLELLHTRNHPDHAPTVRSTVPGPDDEKEWAALEAAKERVSHRHPELEVVLRTWVDDPSAALVSRSEDAAFVVVGSHGRSFITRLLLGSVSRDVVKHARCPVVVVRGAAPEEGVPLPVVVGVDSSAESAAAVRLAVDEAALRRVPLLMVHAWAVPPVTTLDVLATPPELEGALKHEADRVLAAAVEQARAQAPVLEIRTVLPQAHPVAAVVELSRRAQLLVLGAHGHGGSGGHVFGSVTNAAVAEAHCPVMVAPLPAGPKP